jgi:hypothetical protein
MNQAAARTFIAFLCAALLAACTDGRAERMAAMNQFVGQPEQTLLLKLGVPTRSYDAGGMRFLAYDERRTEVIPPPPTFGPWWWAPQPAQVVERWCETTFQVANGVVRSFTLRGNSCG